MARARVLLAEDYEVVAEQLRVLLEAEFDVVATVDNGVDMIAAAKGLLPDVIVADISMPGLDGLAAAARILADHPKHAIVFVTVHSDSEIVRRAMEVGALGYVSKVTAGEDLLPAVRAALRGQRFVSPFLCVKADELVPPT
jgi:DNA-binding NarL/FixJ family response regulator